MVTPAGKHKATVVLDKDLWLRYRRKTAQQGTSASAQFDVFMQQYVDNPINIRAEELSEDTIFLIANRLLDSDFVDRVAALVEPTLKHKDRMAYLAELKSKVDAIGADTDDTDDTDRDKDTDSTNSTANISTTVNTDDTNTIAEIDQLEKPIEINGKTYTEEDRKNTRLAKFQRFKPEQVEKVYSDREVSEQEGLSRQMMSNVRRGERGDRNGLEKRWGLTEDGKKWVKSSEISGNA